ncbi:MAG: hypothetical protein K6347_06120 [Campylobacterales bacterium]
MRRILVLAAALTAAVAMAMAAGPVCESCGSKKDLQPSFKQLGGCISCGGSHHHGCGAHRCKGDEFKGVESCGVKKTKGCGCYSCGSCEGCGCGISSGEELMMAIAALDLSKEQRLKIIELRQDLHEDMILLREKKHLTEHPILGDREFDPAAYVEHRVAFAKEKAEKKAAFIKAVLAVLTDVQRKELTKRLAK